MIAGFRLSGAKIPQKVTPPLISYDERKIDEEENDDEDIGDISEGMIVPTTPLPKNIQMMRNHEKSDKDPKSSSTMSGAHTRTNSSKAQSLRGSVHVSKPLGSHFSSIASV